MNRPILLVSGEATPAAHVDRLRQQVVAAGFDAERAPPEQAVDLVREKTKQGEAPDVILVDAEIGHVGLLARRLRGVYPVGHLIFACSAGQVAPLRRELQRTPMIGSHWSIADTDDPALARIIGEAAHGTQRRLRLRTTLDRANSMLQAQRPADGLEYRRLLMSERYLESFLSQSSDAIVALDGQSTILYCNASAGRLFAIEAKAMLGMHASKLPCWTPEFAQYLSRTAGGEKVQAAEFDTAIGERYLPVEVVFSRVADESGGFLGTTLVIRDISARRLQAEAERLAQDMRNRMIERERERLVRMFDQAPGFMAIMQGPAHTIELANQTFHRLFSGRELLRKPIRDALPDVSGQPFLTQLDAVFRDATPHLARALPVSIRRGPELVEQVFVDLVYQPVFDDSGHVTGIFCQGNDVTAQKLAQDQLIAHQMELEELVNERTKALHTTEVALHQSQKLEAIGKLTGGVAHDFNNILQVIASNLEMLQAESRDNPVALARLQKAIASVDRGAKLSSQLLSFARRQPLQPVPTNLGRIVRDMDDLLRRALGESIQVETIVGGGLWIAMVDRNQLENVILNMAINARDAMQSEGRLTIELGNAMLDDAYVHGLTDVPPGQYVMLAVSDTGSGMTPETMERVFEPFFTTKREGEGTGLGLSMVYGFVKQSGGHIRIYSELGHGTTFKIYLPRVHAAETIVEDIRRAPATGGTETILVVEDDLALQGTVVEMLNGLGYKTLKANDGESALSILNSGIHIDLLFTDVVMPGSVRSPDLARQAKEIQPGIEVLFTSGYTQNAIVHGGRLDPGVELISKPYRRDDLARKIGHMLANRRQVLALETALDGGGNTVRNEATAPSSRRVLVVEDNADALDMLCELLRLLGYDATAASNGEEAVRLLADREFHILLTDIGLPGISGIDLATQAKRSHPGLKVIFASGYGEVETLDFQASSLPKPYDLAELQRVLEENGMQA
ncbi:MAG: response regulator [Janthinobacterium lividum]